MCDRIMDSDNNAGRKRYSAEYRYRQDCPPKVCGGASPVFDKAMAKVESKTIDVQKAQIA
jgi:hypothetical protein